MRRWLPIFCAGALAACGGAGDGDDQADTTSEGSTEAGDGDGDGDGDGECEWTEIARGAADLQRVEASVLGDQDDDGRDELLFSDCGERPCVVFSASAGTLPLLLDESIVDAGGVFLAEEPMTFTRSTWALEDLDGDGAREIAIVENVYEEAATATIAYSAGGWTNDRVEWILDEPNASYAFVVASVPDVDGDGRADLWVERTYVDEGGGATGHLLSLDPHGKTWEEALADPSTLHVTGGAHLDAPVVADLDGDGLHDLVMGAVGDPLAPETLAGVAVIWGPVSGGSIDLGSVDPSVSPSLAGGDDPRGIFIHDAGDGWLMPRVLSSGLDFGGDGIDDLAVWVDEDVWIVRGDEAMQGFTLDGATPSDLAVQIGIPTFWWAEAEAAGGDGARTVTAWSDENLDGFDDLLVHLGGRVRLVHGSNSNAPTAAGEHILDPVTCALPTDYVVMGGVGAITDPGSRQLLLSSPNAALDGLDAAGRVFAVDW